MHKITWCKFILLATDFLTLFSSLFIAYEVLDITRGGRFYFPLEEFNAYILIHACVSFVGVLWFWIRLRHYTYRKPFWFELKEIIRTLLILFIIELAIVAFSRLYVSRYFWSVTWICIFVGLPFFRILVKKLLIKSGMYLKETIIIGNGKNAKEVFNALNNESYLGFDIKLFVTTEDYHSEFIEGIPVMHHNPDLLMKLVSPEFTQFILAIDEENKVKQDFWLRYLIRKGCRSISVIPDFRGIPLYGTDMSFLFSQEMVLFRVNNNLAKRSSKIVKRTFDILGSSFLLLLLLPFCIPLYFILYQSPDFSIISTSWLCDTCSNIFDVEFASFLIFAVSTVTLAVFAAKLLLKNTKLNIPIIAIINMLFIFFLLFILLLLFTR